MLKMKIYLKLFLIVLLLIKIPAQASIDDNTSGNPAISGYIKDSKNGEVLVGATILVKELGKGSSTNIYGFYSLSLKPGNYTLIYSFVGYNSVEKVITLKENITINVELELESQVLQEVVVSREKPNSNIVKPEMSVARLEMKSIQRIPVLFGEVDVLKAIQLLPGVQTTVEGSSGFSVRGGASDQNLVLLDEATVYNGSHFMGFFSVFNNDAIKDVKLYKGDIPASSGGRLSSLLDVRMKDGNSKQYELNGGIGLISSRLTVEGPILNDKTSFIVSGRRTYFDVFFPLFKEAKDSRLYFYDLTMKVNHTFNENNRIYLSGYFGRDVMGALKMEFGYGNQTLTLRWNHLFGKKLFLNTTAIYSSYKYNLKSEFEEASSFKWDAKMIDYSIKFGFNYYLNPNNSIQFGEQTIYHSIDPGYARGVGSQTAMNKIQMPMNYALEHGIYALNEQRIGSKISLNYGLRLSIFQNIGIATLYKYNSNYEAIDTLKYKSGDVFNTYMNLEPRLSMTYAFNQSNSIKASYSHTVQYIQQASNSMGGTPLDIWFFSSPNVKPQRSDQYALGYFRNFLGNTIETSAEVYYKKIDNVIDFCEFSETLLNEKLEGDLRIGKGRAYGLELYAKINRPKFGGWVSYTYSRAFRTIADINNGKEYRAPYDKPNNINIVLNYELTKRLSLSANWIYATGQPITAPVGRLPVDGNLIPKYSKRNALRYPDYHRLDIALIVKQKKNTSRKWQGEWNFSLYNAYGRKNAWVINFQQDKMNPDITYAEKTYLFTFVPSVTYNFKF